MVFTVSQREMLTPVARDQSVQMKMAYFRGWNLSAFFNYFFLLWSKSLNEWAWGKQWVLFPSSMVTLRTEESGWFRRWPLWLGVGVTRHPSFIELQILLFFFKLILIAAYKYISQSKYNKKKEKACGTKQVPWPLTIKKTQKNGAFVCRWSTGPCRDVIRLI